MPLGKAWTALSLLSMGEIVQLLFFLQGWLWHLNNPWRLICHWTKKQTKQNQFTVIIENFCSIVTNMFYWYKLKSIHLGAVPYYFDENQKWPTNGNCLVLKVGLQGPWKNWTGAPLRKLLKSLVFLIRPIRLSTIKTKIKAHTFFVSKYYNHNMHP